MEDARKGNDEQADHLLGVFGAILYKKEKPEPEQKPPVLIRFHAYLFFSSVWELIRTVSIPINGEELNFAILFQDPGGEKKPDDKTGWVGISYEVATSGVFGNVKQVNDTPFWDVLLYLYKCRFESLHTKK